MNVKKTYDLNLCVSCEICKAICPVNAINIEYEDGNFVPRVKQKTCIDCNKCINVCPGIDIDIFLGEDFENWFTGSYIEGYTAYTKNQEILHNSTSGGAISQLLIKLLKNDDYKGAFVLPFDMFDGKPARLELATNQKEIKVSSKSKYIPASVFNIVTRLKKEQSPNYIIVGTPCQLSGIKKFIEINGINDENLLFFGLFCDKTLNYNVLDYFENKFSKKGEELERFDYRNKEKDGWPGHPKLYFNTGREQFIDRSERTRIKEYFQLERCLYCLDKLNRQADISFGDCYIEGKKNPGRSNLIIRTKAGKKVWDKYKHLFKWEESDIDSIRNSQKISKKKKNLEFVKMLFSKDDFFEDKIKNVGKDIEKKLEEERKKIQLGRNKKYFRINLFLFKKGIDYKIRDGKNILNQTLFSYLFYFKDIFCKKKRDPSQRKGKNVVIFGGGLVNKGAQAMTLTVVDQIKRRFPDKNIYLFTNKDYSLEEKKKYAFEILKFDRQTAIEFLTEDFRLKKNNSGSKNKLKKILNNTHMIIDISGYSLSSQTTSEEIWGILTQINYLTRIMIAKKLKIPIFILPQSIGPFNYNFPHNVVLLPLLHRFLKYPIRIYPREPHGVEALNPFTQKNVKRGRDIVLLNEGYDLCNIFNNKIKLSNKSIPNDSIGIIPNNQVMRRIENQKIYDLYEKVIKTLRNHRKKVYILRHSREDQYICENIKELFKDDEDVRLLKVDLTAIELENIISQFNFIIGSRYHSIIHAFKNGIPAIVLGWAIKYQELLRDFDQIKYHFDIRENFKEKDVIKTVKLMLHKYSYEKSHILKIIEDFEKNPIFDDIENYFQKNKRLEDDQTSLFFS